MTNCVIIVSVYRIENLRFSFFFLKEIFDILTGSLVNPYQSSITFKSICSDKSVISESLLSIAFA